MTTATRALSAAANGIERDPPRRLSLKPIGSKPGYVDGAWSPASNDLVVEAPGLVAAVADRIGPVSRVSYDLAAWTSTSRQVVSDGRRIKLDGFRGRRPADCVHLVGANGQVLTLLVIPIGTPPADASRTLGRASASDNTDDVDSLLNGDPGGGANRDSIAAADRVAEGRWESEGGHDIWRSTR